MRRTTTTALAVATSLTLAACSFSGSSSESSGGSEPTGGEGAGSKNKQVVLVTHDSFNLPKGLQAAFTKETGYTLKVQPSGDAGEVTNKLVLTKDSPIGDVVFGIDNTFASRAVDAGVLEDYTSPKLPKGAAKYALGGASAKALTPVDNGSTCWNVDTAWFAKRGLTPPQTFDDLLKPQYAKLAVAPGAPTSSPGLSLLLATVAKYGESGWQGYWKKLMANGLKLTSGWEDAYNVDFSAGEGKGDRPIVWSYDSSPAFTVSGGKTTTKALLQTCSRQVEYVGVVKGAKNPEGAKKVVDWMVSPAFQKALPDAMYVFPVDPSAPLPKDWKSFAPRPTKTWDVAPATIAAKRQTWLTQWQDVTSK